MKTSQLRTILLAILLLGTTQVPAQDWTKKMQKNDANFYDIKKSFNAYWKGRAYERARGFKQYKRWEYFWEKRVLPNGEFPQAGIKQTEWKKYLQKHPELTNGNAHRTTGSGNWTPLGPSSSPGGYQGVGRINCVGFHPSNANIFYVGTPAGGLWKTIDGGGTWASLTDDLPIIGVSSIAVHPGNPNIMYIATGDADGSDTPSIGVMKSTDGGASWSLTGLNWTMSQGRQISVLLIHPNNPDILIAATSIGIYKTTNGGSSWSQTSSGYFRDLEFKPGTPATMYATGRGSNSSHQIFLSTNTGDNWSQTTNFSGKGRVAIAVSPANPNLVAAVTSGNDNGFAGFYTSSNSGNSFSLKFSSASKNLLGWNIDGNDSGGQGWYDLAITVSPTNANVINVGGVNNWQTTNGGTSWAINTMWFATGKVPEVHADKHFLVYHPLQNTTMFECNDGGIYKTTNGGSSWTDITNGIAHTQFYKIGVSQTDPNYVVAGAQDNGTKLRTGTNTWTNIGGGDGMECIIDPTDKNTQYYSLYYGRITRISNGSSSQISDNVPGKPRGDWVTPYMLDPSNNSTILIGYRDLYRSTNKGDSWTNISNGQVGSSNLSSIAVAPSNSNTIYVSNGRELYRTSNASSWSNISSGLPTSSSIISYIAVSSASANTVWVTLSGYASGNKVFKSTNGGSTWTNISGSLPNLPVNCIVHDSNTSNESLYVGTDVGIFYRSNTQGDWVSFSNGLPNVVVRELEIQRTSGKLRAGTYGRGLWESDLFGGTSSSTTPGITSFSPSNGNIGTSVTVQGINFTGANMVKFNGVAATTFSVVSGNQLTATVPTGATSGKISITTTNGTGTSTINFIVGTGTSSATYCESKSNSTEDSRIEKVVFNTIDNSSNETGNTQNGGCVSYSDFTNVMTNVMQGQSYELKVTLGSCGSDYSKVVKVFIDYNRDGDFADTGEEVAVSSVMNNGVFMKSITIPAGASNGTTRMRVVCREKESGEDNTAAATNTKACGTYSWGETEDYSLTIGTSGSAPAISSFTPTSGVEGNQITINGNNFTGAGTVQFNGVNATFNVVSATQVTAIVPANATTGKIKIVSSGGTSESTSSFMIGNAEYCKSGPDPALESASDDSRIEKVILGSINNVTTSGCATYSDYTNITTKISPGQTLPLTVTVGTCGAEYSKVVKVFIDWNGDRDFDDANEEVAASGVMGNGDLTKNITAPANLSNGSIRMRVVCREKVSGDNSDQEAVTNTKACGFYGWGETQDYTIEITGGSGGGSTVSYCSSSAGEDTDSRIEKVVFNSIDNSSASGCATYSDFTSISTTVDPGKQYSLTVTLGTCGTDYPKGLKAYIDWNLDGDFDDANEEVAVSTIMGNGDFTANITVPATASGGNSRLRLVLREKTGNDADNNAALANIKPCGQYNWGETEDYAVVISGPTTGVTADLFAKAIRIAPNPMHDNSQIIIDNFETGKVSFTLTTLTGLRLKHWKVNKTAQLLRTPLSLHHLSKGIYLLQVKMNGLQNVKRIIKN